MKLTAKVKLCPTPEQAHLLKRTLETANAACDSISAQAWHAQEFNQFRIHKLSYAAVRADFPLTAQVVIRAIAKVADAYKANRKRKRGFKPHGAIAYDNRILNWRLTDDAVSIWCLGGRQVIPFRAGPRQRELLLHQRGETDLALIDRKFYLFSVCEIEEPKPADVEDMIGVDLGIVNIATTSEGEQVSGSQVNRVRYRHRRLRAKLQCKGTHAAKRHLK
jgi:putative transposase